MCRRANSPIVPILDRVHGEVDRHVHVTPPADYMIGETKTNQKTKKGSGAGTCVQLQVEHVPKESSVEKREKNEQSVPTFSMADAQDRHFDYVGDDDRYYDDNYEDDDDEIDESTIEMPARSAAATYPIAEQQFKPSRILHCVRYKPVVFLRASESMADHMLALSSSGPAIETKQFPSASRVVVAHHSLALAELPANNCQPTISSFWQNNDEDDDDGSVDDDGDASIACQKEENNSEPDETRWCNISPDDTSDREHDPFDFFQGFYNLRDDPVSDHDSSCTK